MTVTATLPDQLVAAPTADSEPALPRGRRAGAWLRANRLFTAAFAVASMLRLLVFVAYPPALEFLGDSPGYLAASRHPFSLDIWHPFGYPLLLWTLSPLRTVGVVTLLQHVMGLASGVLAYRLIRACGVGSIGGVLAASPVLFDAYQLDVEQFLLSDTMFTLLVLIAATLMQRLLGHGRDETGRTTAIALGVDLAGLTLTRTAGLAVTAAFVFVLAVTRIGWQRLALAAAAFAVPVGGYALAFHATYGVYGLQGYGGRYLYGQVAPYAHCSRAALPVDERRLCPTLPTYARPGVNQYVWDVYNEAHLPGTQIQRSNMAGRFARPLLVQDARGVAGAVVTNFTHFFAAGRATGPRDWPVGSWQFPTNDTAPVWHIRPARTGFRGADRSNGSINVPIATVLRDYQRVFFTPGPALLLAILLAAGGSVLPAASRGRRATCAAIALAGVGLLVMPSVSAGFDWRYLLPAQALIAPAGVLGGAALAARARPRLGRGWRRATPAMAAAAALGLVAPGLANAAVYDRAQLHATATAAVPATRHVGRLATVYVGAPKVIGARCQTALDGNPRLFALIALHVTVTNLTGRQQLVQTSNFALSPGDVDSPGIATQGSPLADVVLSSRYPTTSGMLYAVAGANRATLRYVDPMGGGAAAWTVQVPAPRNEPPLGSRCTGSAPWAGVQLNYLRFHGLSPFTELVDQPFSYGLSQQPWRADNYDLRFRVATPTFAPMRWQYPNTWEHTTLQQQTLLQLTPGATYCFEVRARDEIGATTGWSDPTCTTKMYDDSVLPVDARWIRASGKSGFDSGTYTATSALGATISVSGAFSRVSLVAYHCPTCGTLNVYRGSTLLASLNLATSNGRQGLRQWTSPVLPEQQATLTLRVTSANKVVAIDSLGLART